MRMIPDKRLNQYRGVLTCAQIAAGMNAARQNALTLVEDAKLLFNHRPYPRATALAILSIEESGKLAVLRELALARNAEEMREAWRRYRTHTEKNRMWTLVDDALGGASKLEDFRKMFAPDSHHPHVLDQLKQLCFYTDCLGKAHWSIPQEVIEETLATMLVRLAEILAGSRETAAEEIELWIQHMQPTWRCSSEQMQEALVSWDKAMRARGLLPDDHPEMETFIREGLQKLHKRN